MTRERAGFNHKGVLAMGILMLLSGALSVILGGVQIGIRSWLGFIGYGIWCGLVFIVTGILGITSWRYKNNCNIIALMVMCIISSIFAFTMFVHACVSTGLDADHHYSPYDPYNGYRNDMYYACYYCTWAIPLEAILIFLSLLVFVTSIVCSAFCCKAVCCRSRTTSGTVVGYQQGQTQMVVAAPGFYPPQGQQVVFMPNQAGVPQQFVVQGYHPQAQMMAPPAGTVAPPAGTMAPPAGQPAYQPQAQAMAPPEYATIDSKTHPGTYDYTQLQEQQQPPQ